MQDSLHRVYVAESVTQILELLGNHDVRAIRRPRLGYAIGEGDHRLYSSVEMLGDEPHIRDGVPESSMAYIELIPFSPDFVRLKAIVDEHLTPVSNFQAA